MSRHVRLQSKGCEKGSAEIIRTTFCAKAHWTRAGHDDRSGQQLVAGDRQIPHTIPLPERTSSAMHPERARVSPGPIRLTHVTLRWRLSGTTT